MQGKCKWKEESSIACSNLMYLTLSPHRCVHIGLEASEETDVTLLVSYVVSNASWSPAYDVRVLPVTKEMKVGTIGVRPPLRTLTN